LVGLGWEVQAADGAGLDLDASCFMLKSNGQVPDDQAFVFYNNLVSGDGSVEHAGDNIAGEGYNEAVKVNLSKVPDDIKKLVFAITIHEAKERRQNFGLVSSAFIRVVDQKDKREIVRFDLARKAGANTALVLGEIYRRANEWKFKALAQGFEGGLGPLAGGYGVNV
jgi:tellurium resistance protein TerD